MENLKDIEQMFIDIYIDSAEEAEHFSDEALEGHGQMAFERILYNEVRLPEHRKQRERWQKVLLSPPEGWFVFGTHVDKPDRLEFWGEDPHNGMPLWERPF